MNSKLKGLIVCGVFVVCLAAVALFLKFSEPSDKDDSSQSSKPAPVQTETIPIVDFARAQVKNIAVKNEYGEFNISQPTLGEEEWTVDELKGVNIIDSLTASAATAASELSAKDIAEENASDLSKYGLDQPKAEFTVSYSDYDHSEKTFLIGNDSPESGYVYLCEKGSSKVYTVAASSLLPFTNKIEYFVTLTLLDTPDEDEWPPIDDLVVSRSDWDYQVKFRNDDNQTEGMASMQVMYEPIYMSLNVSNSTNVTHGLWGLTADDTVKVFPKEEDFSEYGIDKPVTTVDLSAGEDSCVLKIGNPIYITDETGKETSEIGAYYAYIEGVEGRDAIYIISAEKLPWATFKMEDVITSLMTTNAIGDLDKITVKGENADHVIEFFGEETVTQVKIDGSDVDVDLAKDLYQELLTCPTNEIYFKETEGEPYLTIAIVRKDGDEDVMEFVKDTDRRTAVYLNGRPQFRIASTWTELFLENIQNVIDGKEIKQFV